MYKHVLLPLEVYQCFIFHLFLTLFFLVHFTFSALQFFLRLINWMNEMMFLASDDDDLELISIHNFNNQQSSVSRYRLPVIGQLVRSISRQTRPLLHCCVWTQVRFFNTRRATAIKSFLLGWRREVCFCPGAWYSSCNQGYQAVWPYQLTFWTYTLHKSTYILLSFCYIRHHRINLGWEHSLWLFSALHPRFPLLDRLTAYGFIGRFVSRT